ncbi:MAG: hypothetical protein ACRDWS_02130 [Acidimicrobiia bacterium]
MSVNQEPPGKRSRRISPDEFAREVAKGLKAGSSGRGEHRRSPRFDVVTVSRLIMGLGLVLLGLGAMFAVIWIGRLASYETVGSVIDETPVFGCPGETEIGALFSGETVQVVGRTGNRAYYAVRDGRGPGNVVYADAAAIAGVEDAERLPVRSCEPRDLYEILAAETSLMTLEPGTSTTVPAPTTTTPGESTSTEASPSLPPPRRGPSGPGTPTTTAPPTTMPGGPGSSSSTTAPNPTTTSTTSSTTSSSTASTTTTTSSTTPTTTTTPSTTTTTTTTTSSTTMVP